MKTLILPFELIQPIFLNVIYDKMSIELFRFSLRIHDLISIALSKEYKLVVYFLEPMNDDWAQIYASQIRHHYQLREQDFYFIPLNSLSNSDFLNGINREMSLLFVPKSELGNEIRQKNFTNTREIDFEIEPKVIGWAINLLAPRLTLEKVSDQSLEEMFSLIDQVAYDSVTKQMLYHDLEIILSGSKNRKVVLDSMSDYIRSLLTPRLGRLECYLKSRELHWLDHGIKVVLAAQRMTIYYFFLCSVRTLPLNNLIDHVEELARIYVHISPKTSRKDAQRMFTNLANGNGLAPLLAAINAIITNSVGDNLASWYTISSTHSGHGIRIKIEKPEFVKCFIKK